MTPSTTRFGSPASPASHAASVLRARASAAGVDLVPASAEDLAAAVLAADAWVLVTGKPLDHQRSTGKDGVAALAALLTRAAGFAEMKAARFGQNEASFDELCPSPDLVDLWLPEAEAHGRWAVELAGDKAPCVMRAAAHDLTAAGHTSDLSGYAALLAICADHIELGLN